MMVSATNSIAAFALGAWAVAIKSTFVAVVAIATPDPIEGFASYNKPVRAGESIVIDWQVIKRVECLGTALRVWRGENGFRLHDPISPFPVQRSEDWKTYHVTTKVPESAPAGFLRLHIEGIYDCPEKRHTFTLGPVVLTVVDNKGMME